MCSTLQPHQVVGLSAQLSIVLYIFEFRNKYYILNVYNVIYIHPQMRLCTVQWNFLRNMSLIKINIIITSNRWNTSPVFQELQTRQIVKIEYTSVANIIHVMFLESVATIISYTYSTFIKNLIYLQTIYLCLLYNV